MKYGKEFRFIFLLSCFPDSILSVYDRAKFPAAAVLLVLGLSSWFHFMLAPRLLRLCLSFVGMRLNSSPVATDSVMAQRPGV
jgi:hypothetical protein